MSRKAAIGAPVAILAACVVASCGGDSTTSATSTAMPTASSTTSGATSGTGGSASEKAYRAQVIRATDAWLKTLTAKQRDAATYDFGDTAAKQAWSNFPAFFKPRTGVDYGATSDASDKAAEALARTLLSSQGYAQYSAIRQADTYLGQSDNGGGGGAPGGGGSTPAGLHSPSSGKSFSGENYFTSVFGTPSMTKPFMVSLNGHHLSFNVTFNGRLSNTPEFTGVEPSSFKVDGNTVQPMADEAKPMFALLPELPASAKLGQSFDDVLVGPQKDGQFPSKQEGVKVSDLPADQQKLVTELIRAYVGDMPDAIAKSVMASYEKDYGKSYVAYSGSAKDEPGTYIRVDGPGVWIELCVQSTDKGASHYHSVYRDKQHDYGAS